MCMKGLSCSSVMKLISKFSIDLQANDGSWTGTADRTHRFAFPKEMWLRPRLGSPASGGCKLASCGCSLTVILVNEARFSFDLELLGGGPVGSLFTMEEQTHTHTHTHTHIYIHTHTHTRTHARMHAHTHTHTHTHTQTV